MYVCIIWSPRVRTCMFSHKLHLEEMSFQDSIRRLKESRVRTGFKWDERLFQIFRPKTLKLFLLYLA